MTSVMCDIGNNGNSGDSGDRGEWSWGDIVKGGDMFDVSDKSEGADLKRCLRIQK